MAQKIKQIAALIPVIFMVLFIIATFIVSILDFPNKAPIFTALMSGVIFIPIFLWIFIWMIGILTKKKNIASFRSEEMEKTMEQAELIKDALANQKRDKDISENNSEETDL